MIDNDDMMKNRLGGGCERWEDWWPHKTEFLKGEEKECFKKIAEFLKL